MTRRFGAAVFSLLLLAPLAAAPGFGTEALRLAAVLGLVALLMAGAAMKAVREREGLSRSDPLLTAASLFLSAHILSLAAAPPAWEAVVPLAVLSAGVAAYALARGGLLPSSYVPGAGLWVLAGLGLAVAGIGLVQKVAGLPAVSSEGNTNYSGTLAGMLLPVTVVTGLTATPWKSRLSAAASAGLVGLLLASESRAGLAGAAAGCAVAGAALWARRGARAGLVVGGFVVLLIAAALLFGGSRYLSSQRAETASVRAGIWKGALAMLAERPWLGAGAGGFASRFPPHRDAEEFAISNRGAGPDFKEVEDAHSIWVQVAAETGVPGLLAFLLALYVAARLWRYYVKAVPDAGAAAALAGLGGGAAAYLVAGFFNTLTLRVSHTLLFWAFLGMIELAGNPRVRLRGAPAPQAGVAVPAALTFLFLLAAWVAGTLAWMDRQFGAGMRTASAPERAARFREALRIHPPYWPMRYELARALAAAGAHREGAAEYRAVLAVRPHHVPALNNLAVSLLHTPEGEDEAERHLRHAAAVAPYYYLSHYNWGTLEARRGRFSEARARFSEALRWNPGHARSFWSVGATHLAEGRPERALEPFRRARELGMDVAAELRRGHPSEAADPRFAEFFR